MFAKLLAFVPLALTIFCITFPQYSAPLTSALHASSPVIALAVSALVLLSTHLDPNGKAYAYVTAFDSDLRQFGASIATWGQTPAGVAATAKRKGVPPVLGGLLLFILAPCLVIYALVVNACTPAQVAKVDAVLTSAQHDCVEVEAAQGFGVADVLLACEIDTPLTPAVETVINDVLTLKGKAAAKLAARRAAMVTDGGVK